MVSVLTHLDSHLYATGTVLIAERQKVEDLIVVASGKLNLFGFYDHRGEHKKMQIVKLPTCSWYGDFQILLNFESTFQLEAGKGEKGSKHGKNII